MIYLDYAANTPVRKEVLAVFEETSREYIANPNSSHSLGLQAKERLYACTQRTLALLGMPEREVVYTSGASESNNLAIKGIAGTYKNRGKHIISTYLEHSSVNGALSFLQNIGYEVDYVDINRDGLVDLNHLKALMRRDTILVSVCYVDSEVGLRQPIEEIGVLLSGYPECFFHVDATQAVGKIPVSLEGVDLFTFSPHKFYGLNGCGALVKKAPVMLEPLVHGGISTTPFRSGTPALSLIAAADEALFLACSDLEKNYAYVRSLNEQLRATLQQFRNVRINSTEHSIPFILNVSLPDVKIPAILVEFEKNEIYLSSKSACCAPNTIFRPVYALTHDRKAALSTLRVSLSHLTTEQEIARFLEKFAECLKKF
ncbi:Cysteine desulfurase IscS [bioreactor metagenome]|uniref:Cysteine desulfurase IscS n=1 Tax=bioreactor metagenome TaxID=1076179 RepID=A0A644Z355_9ZZZZ